MIRGNRPARTNEKPRKSARLTLFVGTEGIEPSRLAAHDPKSPERPSVAIIAVFCGNGGVYAKT